MVKAEYRRLKSSSSSSSSCKIKNKYKGVRMRSWGSWVSEIRAPYQKTRIWLGSYSTAEAAARAYDAALVCLKGSSSTSNLNLNFPLAKYLIPTTDRNHNNTIMCPKSIQKIAAAAAAANSSSFPGNPNNLNNRVQQLPVVCPSPSSSSSSATSSIDTMNNSCNVNIEDDDLISWAATPTTPCTDEDYSWYNLESPKYNYLINGPSFCDPSMIEDYYSFEEGDIRLWSFC